MGLGLKEEPRQHMQAYAEDHAPLVIACVGAA